MRAFLLISFFIFLSCNDSKAVDEWAPEPVFSGSSEKLKRTKIVGVLDTEIKPGENLIWCSTLVSAWKELEKKVIKEKPVFVEENELVAKLNSAEDPINYVPGEAVYSNAGTVKAGIVEEIKKDLREKFPGKAMPDFGPVIPDTILAYAYLKAGIKFTKPYHENEDAFKFKGSDKSKAKIKSFGIFGADTYDYELASQIGVLYGKGDGENKEFVVDLDKKSEKYQVIVAMINPVKNLNEAMARINEHIAMGPKRSFEEGNRLIIPLTVWKISHQYEELLYKKFKNTKFPEYSINKAQQDIEFKLHSKGAEVESEVQMAMDKSEAPRKEFDGRYIFNKPFYILMRKRGETKPFFVMYVDNSELLHPWE